jgi:hypothetical protein
LVSQKKHCKEQKMRKFLYYLTVIALAVGLVAITFGCKEEPGDEGTGFLPPPKEPETTGKMDVTGSANVMGESPNILLVTLTTPEGSMLDISGASAFTISTATGGFPANVSRDVYPNGIMGPGVDSEDPSTNSTTLFFWLDGYIVAEDGDLTIAYNSDSDINNELSIDGKACKSFSIKVTNQVSAGTSGTSPAVISSGRPSLDRITATSSKDTYEFNEHPAIIVKAYYGSSDTPLVVSGWTSSPENITGVSTGTVKVVISYKDGDVTCTAEEFYITVKPIVIGNGSTGGDPAVAFNLAPYITKPVQGAAPVTTSANTSDFYDIYSIAWYKSSDNSLFTGSMFAPDTAYKAVLTLTPKTGYTFEGIAANSFSCLNSDSVTHAQNSGIVTINFPKTAQL